MKPIVSVVIVSDYGSGDEKGWEDLRETLVALSRQDFDRPAEFLLVESSEFASEIPSKIVEQLPGLKVMLVNATSSYALKTEGAMAAQADLVGVLDGDCAPDPGWLRHLVGAFERHPEVAVVSGRTVYRSPKVYERIIGLLSRGYLDRGNASCTDSIANNNSAFRRTVLLAHPFLDKIGAFGGKLQTESMRQAGLQFHFEPGMLVIHAYEGWEMERDIRRNTGYATIMVRRIDPRIAFSWMARLGYLAIPLFVVGRTLFSWLLLERLRRYYDIPWYHLPTGLTLAVVLHLMEIPGMLLAVRGEAFTATAYR